MTQQVKPVRLQRRRVKGFRLTSPNGLPVVCVTRPGILGNPFRAINPKNRQHAETAVAYYRRYIAGTESSFECGPKTGVGLACIPAWHHPSDVRDVFPKIRGANAACYCALCPKHSNTGLPVGEKCPNCSPCHADVLLELANSEGGAA